MKKIALLASLALFSLPALAEKLACEDLKSQIDAKLRTKGVKSYTLEVVSADSLNPHAAGAAGAPAVPAKADTAKVVGSCDGGGKHITYRRS